MASLECMFLRDGEHYLPQDRARGPWHPDFLHGGPVACLLAHAVEGLRPGPGFIVSRLACDLLLPVPVAPLALETRIVRDGKRIRFVEAVIVADGTPVARASAVLLRRPADETGQTSVRHEAALPMPEELPPVPWMHRPDDRRLFHTGVEIRIVGQSYGGDPVSVWARVPYELFPGHALTPFEHLGAVSDFTNGIGILSRQGGMRPFINGDIVIQLHREPEGGWVCLEGVSRGDRDGLCSSLVRCRDRSGSFGHAGITGMANPLPGG